MSWRFQLALAVPPPPPPPLPGEYIYGVIPILDELVQRLSVTECDGYTMAAQSERSRPAARYQCTSS